MPHTAAAGMATRDRDAGRYQRRRPEQNLLYWTVDEYYPVFTAHLAEQGRELPGYLVCKQLLRVLRLFIAYTSHQVFFHSIGRAFTNAISGLCYESVASLSIMEGTSANLNCQSSTASRASSHPQQRAVARFMDW